MEPIMENATCGTNPIVYVIMMVMGYALFFCFLNAAALRREIRYMRQESEQDLKYHKERVEREFEYLKLDLIRERNGR